jgi:hypothetical protein
MSSLWPAEDAYRLPAGNTLFARADEDDDDDEEDDERDKDDEDNEEDEDEDDGYSE